MSELKATLPDDDLEALFKLARDKSAAGRKALVNAVSDLFFNNKDVLSDREKALMTDILRQIIHDVEMSVRRELAERLADAHQAPHELIVALANDEIEVAHPLLIQSDILHDFDLVEIIHHRTLEHQLAIAMRKGLTENVTDALVETGNEDVVAKMIENPSARISKSTMEYLVDQSKRVDTYQNPLLKRPDIEPELAKKMYWWVSAALRQHIVKNFTVDTADLDETLESTVKNVIDRHGGSGEAGNSKPAKLADRLAEDGKITPRMLVQVLRQGEIPLFEAMFAKISGLRPRLLRRMLFEPGGEALAILCKAVSIDKTDFASIFMLSRKARNTDRVTNPQDLKRILELFDRIQPDAADRMLKKWQRDSNFLNAIRVVESVGNRGDDK
jgi:uncharacterized protein (DUF2336 family)